MSASIFSNESEGVGISSFLSIPLRNPRKSPVRFYEREENGKVLFHYVDGEAGGKEAELMIVVADGGDGVDYILVKYETVGEKSDEQLVVDVFLELSNSSSLSAEGMMK